MDRILIEGDSRQALKRLQVMKEKSWKLNYAAIFFDNWNLGRTMPCEHTEISRYGCRRSFCIN